MTANSIEDETIKRIYETISPCFDTIIPNAYTDEIIEPPKIQYIRVRRMQHPIRKNDTNLIFDVGVLSSVGVSLIELNAIDDSLRRAGFQLRYIFEGKDTTLLLAVYQENLEENDQDRKEG